MRPFDIMTLGVPMVEFTREVKDIPLSQAGLFYGPVPAGDPGIALNACVCLGYSGCYVGVAGADAFAECFLNQMSRNSVDTSHIRIEPKRATGISLLTQFSDGSREFVFTVPDSAAATLGIQDLDEDLIKHVRWIHLSGFALSISDSSMKLHHKLIDVVDNNTIISFDPNYRKQVISKTEYRKRAMKLLERCDYFLPSRNEAILFCDKSITEEEYCSKLSETGKDIVLKDGARGCCAFSKGTIRKFPAFKVNEVDPTGAGDIFDGALAAKIMDGSDFFDAVLYANAAGAIAVTRRGLMDIAPSREDMERFLEDNAQNNSNESKR